MPALTASAAMLRALPRACLPACLQSLIMNPPQPGQPSHELYAQERDAILAVSQQQPSQQRSWLPARWLCADALARQQLYAQAGRGSAPQCLWRPQHTQPPTRQPTHLTLYPPQSLKRRAELVVDTFNGLEGVSCNPVEGALYAFPQLTMPQGARAAAARQGKQPDFVYCMELLDQTGIVTVPGSGFGQVRARWVFDRGPACVLRVRPVGAPPCLACSGVRLLSLLCLKLMPACSLTSPFLPGPACLPRPQELGTFHVRTTILPPEADMAAVAEKFTAFHKASRGAHSAGGSTAFSPARRLCHAAVCYTAITT